MQRLSPDEGRLVGLYGLVPADLWAGRIVGLFTSLGLHGDWRHVGLNALGVLVFGTPVARRLGESARGALSLLAFFVLCGLLAGLAFAAMNPATQAPVIGASGGAFGLIGAATRLMGRPGSAPAPLFSRPVLLMSAAWIGTNLLLAIPFASPGG
ncbi:MAG TPA: rhomboid family intramembrane serine protease, partial [Caulobacteraceae bacterium]